MTKALFLIDSYLKETKAKVISIKDGKYVTLDQTVFYPKGGGQPHDTGKLIKGKEVYKVVYVGKFSGEISHEVDKDGLQAGDEVCCVLNWDRRNSLSLRLKLRCPLLLMRLRKGSHSTEPMQ